MKRRLIKIFIGMVSCLLTVLSVELASGLMLMYGLKFPTPEYEALRFTRTPLPYEIAGSLGYEKPVVENTQNYDLVPQNNIVEEGRPHAVGVPNRLLKNYSGRVKRLDKVNNRVIYDIQVTSDAAGRRIARPPGTPRHSPRHLLMVGCSYTYGSALDDDGSVAWIINELQSEYEAYNGGFEGNGTGDLLARFLKGNELEGVSQKSGLLVYTFLGDHVQRTLGSSATPWFARLSHIEESNTGNFSFTGSIQEAHPWRTAFLLWFAERKITEFFSLSLPLIGHSDNIRIVRMIAEVQSLYKKQSDPENKFIVVLYPQTTTELDIYHFREQLSRHKIHFIDYSNLDIHRYVNGPSRVPYDGHPSKLTNQLFAKVLLRDLAHLSTSYGR